MTKKTKKHIHNWEIYKMSVLQFQLQWPPCGSAGSGGGGGVAICPNYAFFWCKCGKAKKVMVVEEEKE